MRRRHPARRRFFVSIRCSVRSAGVQMRARERYNQSEILILLTATEQEWGYSAVGKAKKYYDCLKKTQCLKRCAGTRYCRAV